MAAQTQQFSQTFNLLSLMNSSKGVQTDNTEYIRKHKVSELIRKDVETIKSLKEQHTIEQQNDEKFIELCRYECNYLFTHQPGIFYRVFKNQLDLNMLDKILVIMKDIEDGKTTQHEASVNVGQMMADLMTDSALRVSKDLDAAAATSALIQEPAAKIIKPSHSVSWAEYKRNISEK